MQLFSQSVEGIIINIENKKSVADVNIAVKNTTIGTVSDRNGIFSLETKNEKNYTIQISCIGFDNMQHKRKSQKTTPKANIEVYTLSYPNGASKSTAFKSGDNMYLYFKSPVDGYLSIYLDDGKNIFKILPYQDDGIRKLFKSECRQRIHFFL